MSRCKGIALAGLLLWLTVRLTAAQEAEWIWSPQHQKDAVPQGVCHFRKVFNVRAPEGGQILIAADDVYELHLNGRKIGQGQGAEKLDTYDIGRFMTRGRNVLAIKVANQQGNTAALAARVMVKEQGQGWFSHSTDASWRTNLRPLPLWNSNLYNDSRWQMAQSFGRLGDTPPWDRKETVAKVQKHRSERFKISEEFEVERIVEPDHTGSLIAMTFNEFGHIIAARENGPLLLIYDSNNDEKHDKVRVYCDKVKNCQGILALNGEVFVTADGPDGAALYRLSDNDRDGKLESIRTLFKFKGPMGEHGAHGITLGPDGLLYIVVGNHTHPEKEVDPQSPFRDFFEGDLNLPKYEDPGGHAVGIKAPGGTIIRTDVEGETVQMVAGGLRNAYDLCFNRVGSLFTWDSDMESDEGLTWYRPTRLYEIVSGGEYGWRSGMATWPGYYVDSVPAVAETGRGSPTGMVVYNHHMFPTRFHDAMFLADWSEGRILVARTKVEGGTHRVTTEPFLEGQPLNVTDLDVGPDGWLYFVTGGRGTSGGLYRVTWRGDVPDSVKSLGNGIGAVIRYPQLHSAWARQKIAALKNDIGQDWDKMLLGVVRSGSNPAHYRTRALDLMQLFGPPPASDMLVQLTHDKDPIVRRKATMMMGLHADEETHERLTDLLEDDDFTVRRLACESLVRAGQLAPVDRITRLLKSGDRAEAWAARRLLERIPVEQWRGEVLKSNNVRTFIQGSLSLVVAHPSKDNSFDVLERASTIITGFVSDDDFLDLLRLIEVALMQAEVKPDEVVALRDQLAEEFPSGSARINRELARLLPWLQAGHIIDRYLAFLNSKEPLLERLHLALQLRYLEAGWTPQQRIELLKFYENAQKQPGGTSYAQYVMNFSRDFAKSLGPEEVRLVLAKGAQWPNAALGALYRLPNELDNELLLYLHELDRQLGELDKKDDAVQRLKVGIVAVLARSGDEESQSYLRQIWDRDPDRRSSVALGLAQNPSGENWEYLLRSLPVLEGRVAKDVLTRLRSVQQKPADPEHYRQAILTALKLREEGASEAIALLEYWTGQRRSRDNESWEKAIEKWQAWYGETYPDRPEAALPVPKAESKWQFVELLEFLNSEDGLKGNASKGGEVFTKAQCAKCHRFGERGESLGPDLTAISRRFTKSEILQSIVFPSHVISDQYASKTVLLTNGKKYAGMIAAGANGETIVLQANGQKVTLNTDDIDETVPSRISSMPEGLLDPLTLDEIANLFAYLQAASNQRVTRQPDRPLK